MRRASALTCWLLWTLSGTALAKETNEAAAVQSAEAWLKLIDASRFGASWDEASTLFRKAVPRAAWEKQAAAARDPLGKVLDRKLASKQLVHELPGVPDGTYVVLIFDTRFERKERARETVTMMLEDGRFRGAGYYIR
jgi:Protein of unknown function (DUF4019)